VVSSYPQPVIIIDFHAAISKRVGFRTNCRRSIIQKVGVLFGIRRELSINIVNPQPVWDNPHAGAMHLKVVVCRDVRRRARSLDGFQQHTSSIGYAIGLLHAWTMFVPDNTCWK